MFSLRSAAARFQEDLFYCWDDDQEAFDTTSAGQRVGRLFRIDRFTTIYHRPTRRRQITFPPGSPMPSSRVVKHASTGEIFILSDSVRNDAVNNVVYERIVSAHLAMAPSGGLGTLLRPTITGAGDDPGPADLVEICKLYFDSELRTTQNEPDSEEVATGHYFLTLPNSQTVLDDDWLVFGQQYYKIVEAYPDSGFLMARAVKENYNLVTITYYLNTGAGGSYDASTGTFTPTVRESRQISALISRTADSTVMGGLAEAETLKCYIAIGHIAWDPMLDDVIEISSKVYRVKTVTMGKNGLQWELGLLQWTGNS